MSQAVRHRLENLVKSQFATMQELATLIRTLNETGQKQEALKLARILDRLSHDSLAIGNTISDRAA